MRDKRHTPLLILPVSEIRTHFAPYIRTHTPCARQRDRHEDTDIKREIGREEESERQGETQRGKERKSKRKRDLGSTLLLIWISLATRNHTHCIDFGRHIILPRDVRID